MRVFGLRILVLAGALSLALSSGAQAVDTDSQSAAAIQIQLVETRQHLNALYDRAAVASEQLNGAIYRAQLAKADVDRNVEAVARAKQSLDRERQAVAALTVQDLQSGTPMARLGALFQADGPGQLLDRSAAYASTHEAMTARIDMLTASTVVYAAAARRAVDAQDEQRAAQAEQVAARATIENAIAKAEATVKQAAADRAVLLKKLAKAQDLPLTTVTKRQDGIDRALDAAPAIPARGNPAAPVRAPAEPKPSTPAKPKPAPPAAPVVTQLPASSNKVETAISFAKAQLGDPYAWGGTGPDSWDCSGLTMKAWAAAGVNLPHFGGAQYTQTKHVAVDDIQRGDLLFWSDGSAASIYHVAIYLGGGQMIQAPRTGRNVEIVPLTYWIRPDLASRPGA